MRLFRFGMIICVCKNVNTSDISRCSTLEEVIKSTQATQKCGKCVNKVLSVLGVSDSMIGFQPIGAGLNPAGRSK